MLCSRFIMHGAHESFMYMSKPTVLWMYWSCLEIIIIVYIFLFYVSGFTVHQICYRITILFLCSTIVYTGL